jgi:hypothetical protein
MESIELKTEALCWLRFSKGLNYVCTEYGRHNADVFGCNDTFSVEIEVKVTKADLKKEFTSKSGKHFLYSNNGAYSHGALGVDIPNYFYFYTPESMKDLAIDLIQKHSPCAGLVVYSDNLAAGERFGKRSYVARRPKKIHDTPPSPRLKERVLMRMGSELCGRYIYSRNFAVSVVSDFLGSIKEMNYAIVKAIKDMSNPRIGEDDVEEKHGLEDIDTPTVRGENEKNSA